MRQYFARLRTPFTVVARLQFLRHLLFTQGFQFLLAAVAIVGTACRQHALYDNFVAVHTLHLIKRTLVVIQTQPLHAV